MKSFGMVYNVLYNAILFLPLLILFDKLNLVSSDFKESKKDFRTHFNVILSVARLYEVKTIILVQFNYSDPHFIRDLIKSASCYFSVIDKSRLKNIILGHEKTMAVCYGFSAVKSGCLQSGIIHKFRGVVWFVMERHLPENFQSFYVPFNYQLIVAQETSQKNQFTLKEVYKFSPRSKLHSTILGFWKGPNALNMTKRSFFQRRSNFWKEQVRIIPYVPDSTGAASANVPDFVPGLWWSMEKRLNATSQAVSVSSTSYDISININHARRIQPLPVMIRIKSRLYYKAVTGDVGLLRYFQPFDWDIWLCTLGFIAVSSAGMVVINKCTIFTKESFHFFLLDALYIFFQQGSQIRDKSIGFFMIQTLQLLLSLLIFYLYGSILISFITVTVNKPPFTDLEGILQNGRYNILAIEGRGRVMFQQSPGIVRDLYVKHVSPVEDSPKTFFEAFYRVCFGNAKLLTECAIELAPKILSNLPARCRTDAVPFTTLKRTFEMEEGNRFEEIFRVCLTKMLEGGAIGNVFWSKAIGLAKLDTEETFESITFSEISSLLLIFLMGYIIALVIFVVELKKKLNNHDC